MGARFYPRPSFLNLCPRYGFCSREKNGLALPVLKNRLWSQLGWGVINMEWEDRALGLEDSARD